MAAGEKAGASALSIYRLTQKHHRGGAQAARRCIITTSRWIARSRCRTRHTVAIVMAAPGASPRRSWARRSTQHERLAGKPLARWGACGCEKGLAGRTHLQQADDRLPQLQLPDLLAVAAASQHDAQVLRPARQRDARAGRLTATGSGAVPVRRAAGRQDAGQGCIHMHTAAQDMARSSGLAAEPTVPRYVGVFGQKPPSGFCSKQHELKGR